MRRECLDKLHDSQMNILCDFDEYCKKNNLRYYLVAGSLLGAVRHGGFIPWDDDIDVAMPREDYERFFSGDGSIMGEKYFVQSYLSDDYYGSIFGKVRLNNTVFMEESWQKSKMHTGIYLDVFPLDFAPLKDYPWTEITRKVAVKLHHYIQKQMYDLPLHGVKKVVYNILSILPMKKWCKIRDGLLKSIGSKKSGCYTNYGSKYGYDKQKMSCDIYNPATEVVFNGKAFSAPNNIKFFLKRLYGENYMDLPPEEKRVSHNPLRLSFDLNGPDEIL